jgi:hypothetical protein
VVYVIRLNGYSVLIKTVCYAFNKSGIGIYQENTLYVCFFLSKVNLNFSINELCGY